MTPTVLVHGCEEGLSHIIAASVGASVGSTVSLENIGFRVISGQV